MSEPNPPTCDRCGSDDAHAVDTGHLCPECFQLAGACCAGGEEPPDEGCVLTLPLPEPASIHGGFGGTSSRRDEFYESANANQRSFGLAELVPPDDGIGGSVQMYPWPSVHSEFVVTNVGPLPSAGGWASWGLAA